MAQIDVHTKISSKNLAALLGVSERRVQQLEELAVFSNVGAGRSKRFVLADAVRTWAEHKEKSAIERLYEGNSSKEQFEAERARKLKLENDKTEHMLIEVDLAINAVDAIVGIYQAEVHSIPNRLTNDVSLRRQWEIEIDRVSAGICKRLQHAIAALESGRDPLDDTGADG